jgi:undecaprenyl-diphosphatase
LIGSDLQRGTENPESRRRRDGGSRRRHGSGRCDRGRDGVARHGCTDGCGPCRAGPEGAYPEGGGAGGAGSEGAGPEGAGPEGALHGSSEGGHDGAKPYRGRFPREVAVLFSIPAQIGYGALFGIIVAESAAVPVPGETALLAAGLLAGSGHLALPLVIAVGAAAAIVGDNLGYLLGRRGGRALLTRGRLLTEHRHRAVVKGERFFEHHGAKTVFLGRWIAGVRIVVAVLAGASAMSWRRFLVYNTLGAVAWAATVAGAAALFGPVGAAVVYGAGLAATAATALAAVVSSRLRRVTRSPG